MKNLVAGLVIGLVLGVLGLLAYQNFFIADQTKSYNFYSTQGLEPRQSGADAIEQYAQLPRRKKILLKMANGNYITSLYLDSTGIRQLVDTSIFRGLCIDIGTKNVKGKDQIQLLFSGYTFMKSSLGKDSAVRYYLRLPSARAEGEFDEYYLDKTCPCPQGTRCPCQE